MERKVLLICAGGMSTGILMKKMEKYAEDKGGNFLPSVPDAENHTIDSVAYSLDRLIFNKNEGA